MLDFHFTGNTFLNVALLFTPATQKFIGVYIIDKIHSNPFVGMDFLDHRLEEITFFKFCFTIVQQILKVVRQVPKNRVIRFGQ